MCSLGERGEGAPWEEVKMLSGRKLGAPWEEVRVLPERR